MSLPTLTRQSLSLCCFFLLLFNTITAAADVEVARQLFAENRSAILQIRLIDLTSGSKSAIGSGFAIDHNGLIATNYHVIERSDSSYTQRVKVTHYDPLYLLSTKNTGRQQEGEQG